MLPDCRVALYHIPEAADPLLPLGNTWLGRDADRAAPLPQPRIPGIAHLTAAPRHYGFHATLRPPMRLAVPWENFAAAARAIAAETAVFPLPPLRLAAIGGFLALVTAAESPALRALAARCVEQTNPLRAPPDARELARRRAAGLTPRQESLLAAWGYPYVMEEWRYHITLTGRLAAPELAAILPAAERHFAPALTLPRTVQSIAIVTESAGAPMRIARRLAFGREDVLF